MADGTDPWVARIVVVGPILLAILVAAGIVLLAFWDQEVPTSLAAGLIGAANIMSTLAGYIFGRSSHRIGGDGTKPV